MVNSILYFAGLLRKAGLRISPAEVRDCLNAVKIIGFKREDFKEALKTTLVKEARDIRVFNKLFDLYFTGYPSASGVINEDLMTPLQNRASTCNGRGVGKSGAGGPAPDLWQVLSGGDENSLEEAAQAAVESLGNMMLEDVKLIRDKLRQAKVNLDWFMVLHRMEKMLQEGKLDQATYQQWQDKLAGLQEKIEAGIKKFLAGKYGQAALERIAELENTSEKVFIELDAREVDLVKQQINRLGRRLAGKKSRRYRPNTRGRVDIMRVTRKAMSHRGIPVKLAYKKRRIERPELILICDISNSVARFSTFMLQLVYVAQNYFKDVHSFVFVEHISYVTPLFKKLELKEALFKMKYLSGVSETGYSHFGRAFFEFCCDYLSLVTDKSTVIILGDAKNNWRPDGVDYLREIAVKCRRLYWLNPQSREEWDKSDSIISTYAPWCTGIYECRNLRQLEEVINRIF